MATPIFPSVDAHVIDTNLFIEFERADAIPQLELAVTGHGVVLLCPSRVYDELIPKSSLYEVSLVDTAIEDGWVKVVDEVDYTIPSVSTTMDMVRRYIAETDDRPEHEVEHADAEVGGATTQLLAQGDATSVAVYTDDRSAFRGIERALTAHGYDHQLELLTTQTVFESVQSRYEF